MKIEYEATFTNIEKDNIRKVLNESGAKLIKKEFLQKRVTFNLPKEHEKEGAWMRVRDEQDKITMSVKQVKDGKIEEQKEIELEINNFENAVSMLKFIGCQEKSYQETKRELWNLDGVKVTIDEWPFLEPFVEVEGCSEKEVKKVSEKLGFDYSKAMFCTITKLYELKYGISEDKINNHTPRIVFEEKNPFI